MTTPEATAHQAEPTTRITSRRGVIRAGLLVLGLPLAATGLWALFAPSGWYETFPGAGHNWLPSYGEFDEHLATDVGATFIALGLLLALAALYMDRRLVQVALVVYLAFEVPHFVFHLGADGGLPTADQIASGVTIALTIALALVLLALTRQPVMPTRAATAGDGTAGSRVGAKSGVFAGVSRWYTRRLAHTDLTPVSVFAHHPRLLLGYGALETAVERSNQVDERLKLIAEMKAAGMIGCEWCMDYGSRLSIHQGVSERQLIDLPRYRDSAAFSDTEKLVLDYAAAMTRTPAEVTSDEFERLRPHFTDAQIVELSTAIAIENFRARFNHALGIEAQGFSDGAVCVVPERQPAGNGGVATSA